MQCVIMSRQKRWIPIAGVVLLLALAAKSVLGQQAVNQAAGDEGWWQWVVLLFVIGMGLSIFHSIKLLRRSASPDAGYWLKRFEQACLKHEASAASQSLLFWAKAKWGVEAPTTLPGIAARLEREDVTLQLQQLQKAVRNGGGAEWNAYLCRQVITEVLAQLSSEKGDSG